MRVWSGEFLRASLFPPSAASLRWCWRSRFLLSVCLSSRGWGRCRSADAGLTSTLAPDERRITLIDRDIVGYSDCTLAKIISSFSRNLCRCSRAEPSLSLPLRCVLIFFKDVVILYVHVSVLWRAEMWKWRSSFILFIITPHLLDTNISRANGKYGECWIILCAVLSKAFMAMLYGKQGPISSLFYTEIFYSGMYVVLHNVSANINCF